nr:glycosyltransferase family 2 protein [Xanthomonadales bacterium]
MAVHNGGEELGRAVDSVLTQDSVNLEFIVVDDGSTDGTADRLARYAKIDSRLKVLRQPRNLGLTEALILGCTEARGEFIARQDSGDRSLPRRLKTQAQWMEHHPGASMVSCHTRNIGLYGEVAFESTIAAEVLDRSLRVPSHHVAHGPSHHGSVMMRATAYRAVGGYRQPFVVAQDIDLWLRLVEVGSVGVVDDVLYESHLSPTGISANRVALQAQFCSLAVRLARARRNDGPDSERTIMDSIRIPSISSKRSEMSSTSRIGREAAYLYFLGRCIVGRDPELARRYFRSALRLRPWHLRSLYGLARSWL